MNDDYLLVQQIEAHVSTAIKPLHDEISRLKEQVAELQNRPVVRPQPVQQSAVQQSPAQRAAEEPTQKNVDVSVETMFYCGNR